MTYKTVMVNLALDRANDARLEIAGQLVERFNAHAIGIAAGEFSPPLYFTTGEQAQQIIDQGRAAIKNRVAEVEAQFRAAMQNRAAAVEWRSAEDFPTRFVIQHARAADIMVVGGEAGEALADPFTETNPNDLVMQLGRPALVVPDSCNWLDLRSVLIAWKDTPEARRAIVDAMPILRQAKNVAVLEIIEQEPNRLAALSGIRDVAVWLSRHGVVASEQVPAEKGNAAEQIERIASEVGAGVVVAGAYGHSRLREWVFGGVTRRLLNPSDRCSLLSR
ncbi:MAG: universal stress protein [Bradyrhizobium sp.]|uniref:universal stress protein n=1 Tax=Bradyrhizobium sp. TaxID=376 RepID=UPI0011F55D7A|nr:universal stress protein [Bradyrhizobium sp.]THD71858.1 MAG: universal stress protein [Bradyrhizobium sp.]